MGATLSGTNTPLNADTDPRNMPECRFVYIIPVRYALTSERSEAIPLPESCRRKEFLVPPIENLDYTLRILREGFLHVYYEAELFGESKLSWRVNENGMLQPLLPQLDGSVVAVGAEQPYIKLPKPRQAPEAVYMAFSDTCWDKAAWERAKNEAHGVSNAPHRLHKVLLDQEAQAPADDNSGTFCLGALKHTAQEANKISVDDLQDPLCKMVEEYRSDPGYLCAIHEYNDQNMHTLFQPEYMHFPGNYRLGRIASIYNPPDIEKECIVDQTIAEKRWRRTEHEFQWKRPSIKDQDSSIHALRTCQCTPKPFLAALADPVGIAMDCASVHKNSLLALRDLALWFGEAQHLAAQITACDNSFFPKQHRPPGYATLLPSEQLPQCIQKDMQKVSKHFEKLTSFWLAWLTGTGNFSLLGALRDFEGQDENTLIEHEKTLAACLDGITNHAVGVELAWNALENLHNPLSQHIVTTFEQSPWAKELASPGKAEKESGLPEILSSLTGLLTAQGAVKAKLEGGLSRKLHDIALEILNRKYAAAKETAGEEKDEDLTLPEDEVYRLSLLSAKNPAEMQKGFPKRDGNSITVPWSTDMHVRYLAQKQKAFPEFNWITHALAFGQTSAKTGGNFHVVMATHAWLGVLYPKGEQEAGWLGKLTRGTRMFATPALYWMRVYGTCDALAKLTTQKNTPLDTMRNLCDLMTSSLGVAEMVLANSSSLVISRTSVYQSLLPCFRGKASRVVESMFPIEKKFMAGLLARSIIFFAAGKAAIDAWDASQKDEQHVWGGNMAILSGCLFMLAFPVYAPFGAVIAGIGAVVAICGKTERLHYRVEQSYFKQHVPELPAANSELQWKHYKTTSMTGLSYAARQLPPNALDHPGFPGSPLYTDRIRKVREDTSMLMLMSSEVGLECYYDDAEKKLAILLSASNVTEESTVKIKKVHLIGYHKTITQSYMFNSPHTQETLEEFYNQPVTEEALNAAWGCCFHGGLPSWYCAIGRQFENFYKPTSQDSPHSVIIKADEWMLKVEGEFFYRTGMDDICKKLDAEEIGYKKNKDGKYKIPRKYSEKGNIVPMQFSLSERIKSMTEFPV